MDAHKRMIISDILSKDNLQFIVPIYQREYKWTLAESDRIVHDILSAGTASSEHFIGSIVYQYTELNMANMRLYLVDGQQRLTTIMLISKALNLVASTKRDEDDDYDYVFSKTKRIIYIDADDKSRGYTVYPSENDRLVFNAIISAKSFDEVTGNHMISQDNFMFNNFVSAYKLINEAISGGLNIKSVIYNGLLNLSVVEIIVDKNENAQAIFESINSLGVKLNNAELIQNFLLMSNDNQEQLYENRWKPMKNNLIGELNMETFVKHYLYLRMEFQMNDDDIYKEFVNYSERFIENGEVNREKLGCFSETPNELRDTLYDQKYVFLKSFTGIVDQLNMWTMYGSDRESGKDCNGCCVCLKPETFGPASNYCNKLDSSKSSHTEDDFNLYNVAYIGKQGIMFKGQFDARLNNKFNNCRKIQKVIQNCKGEYNESRNKNWNVIC